jgi:transcriptional regulator of acetoin/glycerol metabolism
MTIVVEVPRDDTPKMQEIEQRFGGRPIRELIADTLREQGRIAPAARTLGVPSRTLYRWMKQLGIEFRLVERNWTTV